MFTHNKYYTWYCSILSSRQLNPLGKQEKGEIHHIVPRSLGGTNDKLNLVKLTTREHFICHLLLVRFTVGANHYKMKSAVAKFLQCATTQDRVLNSRQYALCRKYASQAASFFRTGTTRDRASVEKGMTTIIEKYGAPIRTGAILSEEQKEVYRNHRKSRPTYDSWFINADPDKKKKDHSKWAKQYSTFVHNNPSLTEAGKLKISKSKSPGTIVTPYGTFESRLEFEKHPVCNKIGYENIFYLGNHRPVKTRAVNRANLPLEWKGKTWEEIGFYIITSLPSS